MVLKLIENLANIFIGRNVQHFDFHQGIIFIIINEYIKLNKQKILLS